MSAIDEVVETWERPMNTRYFHGDARFPLRPENYTVRGLNTRSETPSWPHRVNFSPQMTPYGLVLVATEDATKRDSAILGFTADADAIDCLQIQGGSGRYKQLSPVKWDRALLNDLLDIAQQAEVDTVLVVPSTFVNGFDGFDPGHLERLRKRYDTNAQSFGFRHSAELGRYVREL